MCFSRRRRHTRFDCDWSSDVCSSDLHGVIDQHCGDVGGRQSFAPAYRLEEVAHRLGIESRSGEIADADAVGLGFVVARDRKSTRLNSSHSQISYAVFCLKKKTITTST